MAQCPYSSVGGYTYRIVFTATGPETILPRTQINQPLANSDLPLLTVYSDKIPTAWSGGGPQIVVAAQGQHQVSTAVCGNVKTTPFVSNYVYPCSYTVTGLLPDTSYIFRLRVLTEDKLSSKTYSSPGANSVVVKTPAVHTPSRPLAPFLSALHSTSISVVLQADPNDLRNFSPVTSIQRFEVQTEYVNAPNSWYTFESNADVSPTMGDRNPGISQVSTSSSFLEFTHRHC